MSETTREPCPLLKAWVVNFAVCFLLLSLGALPFFLYPRTSDFIYDSTYYELAHSLLEKGCYGYCSRPETMLPPGFAVIVATLCLCFGNAYAVLIRSMAVFATLFLLATYALLRREVGRGPAAAICLLIGSSPILFSFSTHLLFSDLPYLFTSTLALLAARQLDAAADRRSRVAWWLTFGGMLGCSIMLRSAVIALLGGLVAWLALSVLTRYQNFSLRLKVFLPLLAFGLVIQSVWMAWGAKNEKRVWPVGGYPGSYTSQVILKNGNYPELGKASAGDYLVRVGENVVARSGGLVDVLFQRWGLSLTWFETVCYSPLIGVTVLLILLGLRYSSWVDESGLLQWYFVFHEAMYLLWPWKLELRFLLPVVPLACIYLWRGGCALVDLARREPWKTGVALLGFSMLMAVYPTYLAIAYYQAKKPAAIWIFLALCSASMAWAKFPHGRVFAFLSRPIVLRAATVSVLAILVARGVWLEVRAGLKNVNFDLTQHEYYPDIEAGQWLRSHTRVDAAVMARKEDLVYHYSQRKVIWFPPSSDPKLLINGIREYKIDWIVVVDRDSNYFLPPEDDCFARLTEAYPEAFHLVHCGPHNRIYQVTRNLETASK